ncbi:hypothetical protein PCE1_002649 [Barthelona sp. PCE]
MPRPVLQKGVNFHFFQFGEWIILSTNDETLESYAYQVVSKQNGLMVSEPASSFKEISGIEKAKKTKGLVSALFDKSLFYRSRSGENFLGEIVFELEMFRFSNNEFIPISCYKLATPTIQTGFLLNEKLWYNGISVFNFVENTYVEFERTVEQNKSTRKALFRQNDVIYLVDVRNTVILEILSLVDGHLFYVTEHPFYKRKYYVLDETPGDKRFVFKDEDGMLFYEIEQGKVEFLDQSLDIYCEFIRLEGIIVHKPSHKMHRKNCVMSNLWYFCTLGGKLFCSEYSKKIHGKRFFPVCTCNIRGNFAFEAKDYRSFNGTMCILQDKSSSMALLKNHKIIWDFFNNTITLIKESNMLNITEKIQAIEPYYSTKDKKWNLSFLTQCIDTNEFFMYIGDQLVATYKGDDLGYGLPKFSETHVLVPRQIGDYDYRITVGDKLIGHLENCNDVFISENCVWSFDGCELTLVIVGEEEEEIISSTYSFNQSVYKLKCNHYSKYECLVEIGWDDTQYFFVHYDFEQKCIYCILFSDLQELFPLFIGVGAFIADNIFYFFNGDRLSTTELPQRFVASNHSWNQLLVSPKPGVLVCYERLVENFVTKMCYLNFSDDFTQYTEYERDISFTDFLSQCKMTVFSKFNRSLK